MAIAIYSAKPGKNGKTGVLHVFFGETSEEAWKALEDHADICPKFGPAYAENKTIEVEVEFDAVPDFDEMSIEEFAGVDGEDDEL